jgi:hypothetical protein
MMGVSSQEERLVIMRRKVVVAGIMAPEQANGYTPTMS